MNKQLLCLLLVSAVLPSCIQTIEDVRNNPNRASQQAASAPTTPPIVTKQQKEAVEALQSDDINKDFRELNGRVEVVENQMNQMKSDEKTKALEAKVNALETKIALLETTIADMHNQQKKEAPSYIHGSDLKDVGKKMPEQPESIPYQEAGKLFEKKKWDEAVLAYEEYRKTNPSGKNYADATYKIGVCFENMKSKDDARAFYKEVIEKFPKSKEASLAKGKLKKL